MSDEIHQCKKCGNFWIKGYLTSVNYNGDKIKWYKMLGKELIVITNSIEWENGYFLNGFKDCPQCDTHAWVNMDKKLKEENNNN